MYLYCALGVGELTIFQGFAVMGKPFFSRFGVASSMLCLDHMHLVHATPLCVHSRSLLHLQVAVSTVNATQYITPQLELMGGEEHLS